MRKLLILSFLLCFYSKSFSQIAFEKGYLINESDHRIECEIKNLDWKKNPTQFEYKLPSSQEIKIGNLESVKEFGINGLLKYIKATVELDESSSSLNAMSKDMNPSFQSKEVFLNVLVEGKATLYSYENQVVKRYFYSISGADPKQLIYKKYKVNERVGENNQFRNQLTFDLSCVSINSPMELEYTQSDLGKYFIEYNQCSNSQYETFKKRESNLFHLSVRPGISSNSLKIENSQSSYGEIDFGESMDFRLGLEAEFILPHDKNRWGVIVEPTYRYYKSEENITTVNTNEDYLVSIEYTSIELPIGFRHYFLLNERSKLFINLSYVIEFGSGSLIEFERFDGAQPTPLETHSAGNFAMGAGFKYLDKLNFELRAHTNRDVLGTYNNWSSQYQSFNFIIGYSLF